MRGGISIFRFTMGRLDEIHNQPMGGGGEQPLLFKNKILDFLDKRNPLSIQQNVFYILQMELFLTNKLMILSLY